MTSTQNKHEAVADLDVKVFPIEITSSVHPQSPSDTFDFFTRVNFAEEVVHGSLESLGGNFLRRDFIGDHGQYLTQKFERFSTRLGQGLADTE